MCHGIGGIQSQESIHHHEHRHGADESTADLLFQTSDTTWQAYNDWGGNSLYVGQGLADGRAYKVSYNRPFLDRSDPDGGRQSWPLHAEYPMVRWLEANGYDVSYTTGIDTDRRGAELLEHKVFMSVGHDEYWSAAQRANVEAARDNLTTPVNLAFFSGNAMFWKTRWEDSPHPTPAVSPTAPTPYRTLVCYKEDPGAKLDPADPPTWTGRWSDPSHSPPADVSSASSSPRRSASWPATSSSASSRSSPSCSARAHSGSKTASPSSARTQATRNAGSICAAISAECSGRRAWPARPRER